MTDDLVKRLRYDAKKLADDICGEAADRIEELEEALDALLREAEDLYDIVAEDNGLDRTRIPTAIISARKALKEGKHEERSTQL
jgi:uncharacterized protein (UPF0335 family)